MGYQKQKEVGDQQWCTLICQMICLIGFSVLYGIYAFKNPDYTEG